MGRIRSDGGFTLVELMIVVALIGVLSAVAIPNFMAYQARSRRSEAFSNLSAIGRVQKTYFATKGEFFDSGAPQPNSELPQYGGLGAHKMTWDADSEAAWRELGWKPEGSVWYSYQSNMCCTDNGMCFTASAYGDVDDDGFVGVLMYVQPHAGGDGTVLVECPTGMPDDFNFGTPTGPSGPIYSQVAVQHSADDY